ncbi:MAG: OmpA/MotB family protein [Silvanigrellaceae bacterium]
MQRRTKGSEEGWLLSYADLITNLLLFFVMLLSAAQISRVKMQQIARNLSGAESSQSLESIQKEIDSKIKEAGLEKVVRTNLNDEGLALSLNSGIMFDSGSAAIRGEWEQTLNSLFKTLSAYGKKYSFAVEGHTDITPIVQGAGKFASNWELASSRAIELRSRLEGHGIPRDHIRVEAYADTKPLPESELAGLNDDERLARHRRVVVRVY